MAKHDNESSDIPTPRKSTLLQPLSTNRRKSALGSLWTSAWIRIRLFTTHSTVPKSGSARARITRTEPLAIKDVHDADGEPDLTDDDEGESSDAASSEGMEETVPDVDNGDQQDDVAEGLGRQQLEMKDEVPVTSPPDGGRGGDETSLAVDGGTLGSLESLEISIMRYL
ncbi:hypothetical protein SISNIDRAFT_469743 [Sistotremastrum niveocremeum HHB9708]|uniref:Uncharacterized protein n=1 Tax=Sistotremastrum niveocremeum HHB9708 TaxID=1314777 RepID=A0A164PLM7_9AGAM|nr:hypothetical protein SISNIDRAFT_469743 [Sistotremastrum niveocremeum HHB9708]